MSLSDADDVNVLHQRVVDFIGARVEELTFDARKQKKPRRGQPDSGSFATLVGTQVIMGGKFGRHPSDQKGRGRTTERHL